jgi:hypothetical protein
MQPNTLTYNKSCVQTDLELCRMILPTHSLLKMQATCFTKMLLPTYQPAVSYSIMQKYGCLLPGKPQNFVTFCRSERKRNYQNHTTNKNYNLKINLLPAPWTHPWQVQRVRLICF